MEASDRVGSVIEGRYKVIEVMASGSMGAVYKAERIPVGKLVAVKFLHASFANDSEFQARFERETRVMSKLNHPNCVSVLDFGVFENAPYLVMDFVAGFTLRARIDKAGALPPLEALGIARQILSGLAHAHQQDVFHRDVKPANIMISEEIGHGERVRILDFGLARLQGNVGRDATQTNMVVGTPNYMAPEQTVPGASVDARTDLYAVGVVLYEMITGDRPFAAEDTLQLLGMHRAAPIPRLKDRMPEDVQLPVGLQDLIDKAMAKSPANRFQSAIEFAQAIDEVVAGKLDLTELDVTLPKMNTGPTKVPAEMRTSQKMGLASTMLNLDSSDIDREARPKKKSSGLVFGTLLLLGGGAAMAGYLIKRNHDKTAGAPKVVEVDVTDADAGSAAGSAGSAVGSAETPAVVDVGSAGSDVGSAGSAVGSAGSAVAIDPAVLVDAGVVDDA
ncbi:MAG: serine/threonine protein kinase, partial [Kofleriaceae bacterium]|nr:serine/threonine protein kinase [Kofleriaceae bacterium]